MPSLKALKRNISGRFRRRGKEKNSNELVAATSFPLLSLSDDLIIHVLSFASSAPFECIDDDEALYKDHVSLVAKNNTPYLSPFQPIVGNYQQAARGRVEESKLTANSFGTLTHVLPVVCKKFYELCYQSDHLWKEAMERLSVASSTVWGLGISQIVATKHSQRDASFSSNPCEQAAVVCEGGKNAFQRIVEVYQPFTTTAPLFLMGGNHDAPVLQQSFNLNILEPRYRLMISQLMQSRPLSDKEGSWIASPGRPRFLFSSGLSSPLTEGDPVFLVEIQRCKIKHNGRALITILPILQTRIQSMQMRPNSCALLDATVQTFKRCTLGDDELRLPVFCISALSELGHIPQLHSSIELVVQQERRRRLVREIMDTESTNRPRFILAPTGIVDTGEAALLMEVRKCLIHPDGTANIDVVAIAKGRLRDAIERPAPSDKLYDASIDILV